MKLARRAWPAAASRKVTVMAEPNQPSDAQTSQTPAPAQAATAEQTPPPATDAGQQAASAPPPRTAVQEERLDRLRRKQQKMGRIPSLRQNQSFVPGAPARPEDDEMERQL